jgi:hypothetical protein
MMLPGDGGHETFVGPSIDPTVLTMTVTASASAHWLS